MTSYRDTVPRQVQDRVVRVPSLTIRLSRDSLEQLRSANPDQFRRLIALVRGFDEHDRAKRERDQDEPVRVRMSAADIEKLRARVMKPDPVTVPVPAVPAAAVPAVPVPLRRSDRLAAAAGPRRSARLAAGLRG